ncbi:Ku protein [Streptomyces sp. NPDC058391]|uniref:non-homologous end joining protein Ku n=1 Tax=Streptomyces sp. NPDC058391 TaxID=3346476 RepID=UPI003666C2A8
MPRPIWSGAISFGLVTIPIKVVNATENRSISFHQYHEADGGRVRTRKVCELDDQTVGQEEIGRGYELPGGSLIEITDEELGAMPLPTAEAIEIVAFVPADSIDPIRIGDSYYLTADGAVASKPYVLLRKALERSSKVAVAKFALRGRERLGLLRTREEALVLHRPGPRRPRRQGAPAPHHRLTPLRPRIPGPRPRHRAAPDRHPHRHRRRHLPRRLRLPGHRRDQRSPTPAYGRSVSTPGAGSSTTPPPATPDP